MSGIWAVWTGLLPKSDHLHTYIHVNLLPVKFKTCLPTLLTKSIYALSIGNVQTKKVYFHLDYSNNFIQLFNKYHILLNVIKYKLILFKE